MGFLILFLFLGLIGYAIGSGKGRGTEGFFLGLFLGFIGWIIVACLSKVETGIMCPHCRSMIDERATVCPKCTRQIK